jgi:hypothetical protein
MNVPWKFWQYQPSRGSLAPAGLEHVAVGDPDPTAVPGPANQFRKCPFGWVDQTSQALILPWYCTREWGHQGQHLAGTGEWIAAVHPRLLPTVAATSVV